MTVSAAHCKLLSGLKKLTPYELYINLFHTEHTLNILKYIEIMYKPVKFSCRGLV